jgi:hypothetical protein
MQGSGILPGKWIEVATKCVAEVSAASLSREFELRPGADAPVGQWGSLVSLASGTNVTAIMIASTPEGCRELAGAMLGMDATEAQELSHDDVRDSIGELVNIVAGAIKSAMSGEDPGLALGLPLFTDGHVESDRHAHTEVAVCDVGGTPCVVSVVVGESSHRQAA